MTDATAYLYYKITKYPIDLRSTLPTIIVTSYSHPIDPIKDIFNEGMHSNHLEYL